MGRVNVYLPDDLEREVRSAGLAVSPICQQALRDALDRLAGVRVADAARGRLTPRLAEVIAVAKAERAAMGRRVAGDELLCFIMKHGENLGARALAMLGVDLPDPALVPPAKLGKGEGELDGAAQDLLVDAYRVAVDTRHDDVGSEHIVIAVAEGGGIHGQTLAALAVTPATCAPRSTSCGPTRGRTSAWLRSTIPACSCGSRTRCGGSPPSSVACAHPSGTTWRTTDRRSATAAARPRRETAA